MSDQLTRARSNRESDADPAHIQPSEKRSITTSAAIISICTIVSRITGFIRTWAMAFALGSTMLSSSYQVANNLPNMLFELVVGGMLVTAFLPVYVSVRKRLGDEAGNDYASNIFTIIVFVLGVASLLCIIFPAQIIYTQSFLSDQSGMVSAVFLFRVFAIQILFYGMSSILSGLLNAHRDYLWSSIAPAAHNVIVIASFLAYPLLLPVDYELALWVIAIGNPLGVFVQMAMQWPVLRKYGIRLRLRVNLRDPALMETMRIGIPAVFVVLCSFAVVSVQNAAAYSYDAAGPSILAYSRLWYTFPYSFLVVPITTAMFTELSDMQSEDDAKGVVDGIVSGTNQILFLMIPMAMFLCVFSTPLVTLYHAGAFTADSVSSIASYLCALALSLPLYGVNMYLMKAFSALRMMRAFSLVNFAMSALQIVLILAATRSGVLPIESIAWTSIAFYGFGDALMLLYLRGKLGMMGLSSTIRSCVLGTLMGGAGSIAGGGSLWLLTSLVSPLSGSIGQAFLYVAVCGAVSLIVTFGLAIRFNVEDAGFVTSLIRRMLGKIRRR